MTGVLLDTSAIFAAARTRSDRHAEASAAYRTLLTGTQRPEIIAAAIERMAAAADLLRQRPGRAYSLADAVSFVLMRELTIRRAFTLDADFAAEGFEVIP